MILVLVVMILGMTQNGYADCDVSGVTCSISGATQNWISPDGRACNAIFDMSFAFEMTDTLCREFPNEDCAPNEQCVPQLFDIFMMRRTDVPNDDWQVVPNSAFSEFPDDGSPCAIGAYNWYAETIPDPWRCWDSTGNPLCNDPPLKRHYVSQYGSAGLALPCGSWEIRYLLVRWSWDQMYDNEDPGYWLRQSQSVLAGSRCGWAPGDPFPLPIDIEAEADSQAIVSQTIFLTAENCDTLPPPSNIVLKFEKYVSTSGDSAANWLPTPGDSIGLVYSWNSENPDSVTMRHHIVRISMWAGKCMNSPYAAKGPTQTMFNGDIPDTSTSMMLGDSFPHFDVWVGNPIKYKLTVKDLVDTLARNGRRAGPETPLENRTNYSIGSIRAEISSTGTSGGDTLWIKTRDYASYCEVRTEAAGRDGKKTFVLPFETGFGLSNVVTVPRDHDGTAAYNNGFSEGDYMADFWEMQACSCTDIRTFHPFIAVNGVSADKDGVPEGRKRDGDNFANWEEYRGFMVYGDSSVIHSPHKHLRTDPTRKTFIAKIDTSIDEFLAPGLPTYWNSWTEPQLLFTDSAFPDSLMSTLSRRRQPRKIIDANIIGAFQYYPPYSVPTNVPPSLLEFQNVIIVTAFNPRLDIDAYAPIGDSTLARTNASSDIRFNEIVPSHVRYIWIASEKIDSLFNDAYYIGHPSDLVPDRQRLLRATLSHELGHTVDMSHVDGGIMYYAIPIEASGRVNVTATTFADTSKSEFSIKLQGTNP